MSDDIGFLLIFIVLPTALIVSGFWFALIVRREAQIRSRVQSNLTTAPAYETDDELAVRAEAWQLVAEAALRPNMPEDLPIVIATIPAPRPVDARTDADDLELVEDEPEPDVSPDDGPDPQEPAPPLAAELGYESIQEDSGESTGADISVEPEQEQQAIEPAAEVREPAPTADTQIEVSVETETLPSPPDQEPRAESIDEVTPSADDDRLENESDGPAPTEILEDTEQLPEPAEIEERLEQPSAGPAESDNGDDADDDDDSSSSSRQRQPLARLVPSGETVRKRGRTTNRRVPQIARPPSRDEDAVEREDGR